RKRNPEQYFPEKGNGQMSVNVSEITSGVYDVYIHLRSSDDVNLDVKMQDSNEWERIPRTSGEGSNKDFPIGRVEVVKGDRPVQIAIKNQGAELAFDRVTFAKTKK